MPSVETLLAFFLASSVFAFTPGPALLYTAAQTIARGRNAGWMAVLGIHLGGYAHVIAAALGLSLLLHAVPMLYTVIKLVGAGYVIWLGLRLFRDSASAIVPIDGLPCDEKSNSTFWQSVIVEVLNPKTAIFYIAFLPQFTDPAAGLALWVQLLLLGTFVNLMFSSADIVCVLLASKIVGLAGRSATASRYLQRLGGTILVGLGLRLAFDRS